MQRDTLFSRSIAENIALCEPDASFQEIVDAAKAADAHEFIKTLPGGYDHMLTEGGQTLSGGQQQRICLARLFLSKATLLILDEATSALDAETEFAVTEELLKRYKERKTIIMLTHRFGILKQHADRILVMDQGVLREQGTHEELWEKQGLYYALYQPQLRSI